MAFTDSGDAVFKLSNTDITNYITSLDPTFTRALAEIKTLGTKFVQVLAGHIMASIAGGGVFDPVLDALLWSAFSGSGSVTWDWYPQGEGAGLPHYSGNCMVSDYHPGVASEDADVKEPFTLRSDGVITRA